MARLYKEGDLVSVSGDLVNDDYNVRVSSHGVVVSDQNKSECNVLVTIDEVDGDHYVTTSVNPALLTPVSRKETVLKAIQMFKEAQELIEFAGFRLVFDSYNDNGLYAVPSSVTFDSSSDDDDSETELNKFLADCPIVVEADGFYNDGTANSVEDIPEWWKGWNNFLNSK